MFAAASERLICASVSTNPALLAVRAAGSYGVLLRKVGPVGEGQRDQRPAQRCQVRRVLSPVEGRFWRKAVDHQKTALARGGRSLPYF